MLNGGYCGNPAKFARWMEMVTTSQTEDVQAEYISRMKVVE
jgi:hypothetical protein